MTMHFPKLMELHTENVDFSIKICGKKKKQFKSTHFYCSTSVLGSVRCYKRNVIHTQTGLQFCYKVGRRHYAEHLR